MSGLPFSLDSAGGARLEAYLYAHIPLVRYMQVQVSACDATGLTLTAPLAANINHQSSAFGGSLASLAVLAGWGLLWLAQDHGRSTNIVVRDMHMEFLHPVNGGLRATCALPTTAAWEKFTATLIRRRKARLELRIEIICDAVLCARCTGLFVAYHETAGGG